MRPDLSPLCLTARQAPQDLTVVPALGSVGQEKENLRKESQKLRSPVEGAFPFTQCCLVPQLLDMSALRTCCLRHAHGQPCSGVPTAASSGYSTHPCAQRSLAESDLLRKIITESPG